MSNLTHRVPPAALAGDRAPDGLWLFSHRPNKETLTGPFYNSSGSLPGAACRFGCVFSSCVGTSYSVSANEMLQELIVSFTGVELNPDQKNLPAVFHWPRTSDSDRFGSINLEDTRIKVIALYESRSAVLEGSSLIIFKDLRVNASVTWQEETKMMWSDETLTKLHENCNVFNYIISFCNFFFFCCILTFYIEFYLNTGHLVWTDFHKRYQIDVFCLDVM